MIRPHGIVFARGRWFLVAFCERNAEVRIFRLDRMTAVSVSAHDARPSDDANITATVLADGLLSGCADEQLRIRYSPRVARWLAETSDALLQVDGSLLLRYPLHDDDWAVRHTLSYGPDAIVEAPDRIQTQLASTARLLAE